MNAATQPGLEWCVCGTFLEEADGGGREEVSGSLNSWNILEAPVQSEDI